MVFGFKKVEKHWGQNLRLVQIETNCRPHFKLLLKWKISAIKGRKHCKKSRNCLSPVFCPFCSHQHFLVFAQFFEPITRQQILDWSKLKQSADNNFKFDENSRKFSKQVENTVGKGEIACYKQFLLFPPCFQKACFPGASKGVIVWEWVKCHFYKGFWSLNVVEEFILYLP